MGRPSLLCFLASVVAVLAAASAQPSVESEYVPSPSPLHRQDNFFPSPSSRSLLSGRHRRLQPANGTTDPSDWLEDQPAPCSCCQQSWWVDYNDPSEVPQELIDNDAIGGCMVCERDDCYSKFKCYDETQDPADIEWICSSTTSGAEATTTPPDTTTTQPTTTAAAGTTTWWNGDLATCETAGGTLAYAESPDIVEGVTCGDGTNSASSGYVQSNSLAGNNNAAKLETAKAECDDLAAAAGSVCYGILFHNALSSTSTFAANGKYRLCINGPPEVDSGSASYSGYTQQCLPPANPPDVTTQSATIVYSAPLTTADQGTTLGWDGDIATCEAYGGQLDFDESPDIVEGVTCGDGTNSASSGYVQSNSLAGNNNAAKLEAAKAECDDLAAAAGSVCYGILFHNALSSTSTFAANGKYRLCINGPPEVDSGSASYSGYTRQCRQGDATTDLFTTSRTTTTTTSTETSTLPLIDYSYYYSYSYINPYYDDGSVDCDAFIASGSTCDVRLVLRLVIFRRADWFGQALLRSLNSFFDLMCNVCRATVKKTPRSAA